MLRFDYQQIPRGCLSLYSCPRHCALCFDSKGTKVSLKVIEGFYLDLYFSPDIVQVLDTFFVSSFWSGMISYVSLSLLKLYAVAKPFNYRKTVTMKRCIYLVCISWAVFLIILTMTLSVTAVTKIPYLQEKTGCKLETCVRRMYKVRNLFMVIIYFFTLICFSITGKIIS